MNLIIDQGNSVCKVAVVDAGEFIQRTFDAGMRGGDQLNLGLTEIGGDAGVGERRSQRSRVRRQRQPASTLGAQAFLFYAPAHALEAPGRKRGQPVFQKTCPCPLLLRASGRLQIVHKLVPADS